MVSAEEREEASDASLYLTALAALHDRQPEAFDPAMETLLERHPSFAPGWGLRSSQVQTLWGDPLLGARGEGDCFSEKKHSASIQRA